MNFGPKNKAGERIFAEESFKVDVQVRLWNLMLEKGVSKQQLAARLGISVEQLEEEIFDDDMNLTVKKLAWIWHALGEECTIV